MENMPMLSGGPAFTILAFTVALAAYLRQVSMNAQETIEKIKSNMVRSFPYEETEAILEHTRAKLQLLESTRNGIGKLTPWLFILMTLIASRIVLDALLRLKLSDSATFLRSLHLFDLTISLSILILVVGLWVMHRRARNQESQIRELIKSWESSRALHTAV